MTNITAEQRLALARAVYPMLKCTEYQGCVYFDLKSHDELFEPEENAEQLLDVLCWLLSPALALADNRARFFVIGSYAVQRMRHEDDDIEPVICWHISHNGTPASLSDAVVRAAVRV